MFRLAFRIIGVLVRLLYTSSHAANAAHRRTTPLVVREAQSRAPKYAELMVRKRT